MTGRTASTLTTAVLALAHGISSLFPSLLAPPAPPNTRDALLTIPWTGKPALIPTTPVLLAAPTKTRHSTCFHAILVLKLIASASPTTQLTGRTASAPTTGASVAAHGLPRRPSLLPHASLALTLTHLALPTTQLTGRTASTPITPALMAAHGLLTIRSLL